jgi:hypothetical protein
LAEVDSRERARYFLLSNFPNWFWIHPAFCLVRTDGSSANKTEDSEDNHSTPSNLLEVYFYDIIFREFSLRRTAKKPTRLAVLQYTFEPGALRMHVGSITARTVTLS